LIQHAGVQFTFNHTLTPETNTLSLHDALPILRRGDPRDPLLLQVLPATAELLEPDGYVLDPLEETGQPTPAGLLHKYQGRVLLIDRKSTRLNSSHVKISYAVFCLKKKNSHRKK